MGVPVLFVLSVLFSLESVDLPPGHEIKTPLTIIRANADLLEILAQIQKKELVSDIEPMLFMEGNQKALEQLISVLMDNALKYSPLGSTVTVQLVKQNRNMQLDISNVAETAIDSADISHVFERFYRMDRSRNSETGGHFHYHKHFFSE